MNNDGGSVDVSCDMSTSRPSIHKVQARSEAVDVTASLNKRDNFYETRPLSRKRSHNRTDKVESSRNYSKGKTDAEPQTIVDQNSPRSGGDSDKLLSVEYEGEMKGLGHGKTTTSEPSGASAAMSSSTIPLPSKANSKPKVSQASTSGLKTSVQKVVQHFRPPKSSKQGEMNQVNY